MEEWGWFVIGLIAGLIGATALFKFVPSVASIAGLG